MLTPRTLVPLLLVAATLASCGGDDDEPTKATTITVNETSRVTSVPRGTAACGLATTKAAQLVDSYSKEQRGIVAPDTARYRARARKIIRDARKAGCVVPKSIELQMEQFLGT